MNGTYHLVLTTCIRGAFQRVTTNVGNHGATVHNVILRSDGVGAHDTMISGRNGYICVYYKFLLEVEG